MILNMIMMPEGDDYCCQARLYHNNDHDGDDQNYHNDHDQEYCIFHLLYIIFGIGVLDMVECKDKIKFYNLVQAMVQKKGTGSGGNGR